MYDLERIPPKMIELQRVNEQATVRIRNRPSQKESLKIVKLGVSSLCSLSLHFHIRNSDQMTIENTRPTLPTFDPCIVFQGFFKPKQIHFLNQWYKETDPTYNDSEIE